MKKIAVFAILAAAAIALVGKEPNAGSVVAHEWGTFTSVALDTGGPVRWAPWTGPADLPSFVHQRGAQYKFQLSGLVRMETPVIYFYSQQKATLTVKVAFPKGLVTEWYPNAQKVSGPSHLQGSQNSQPLPVTPEGGGITWDNIEVLPGSSLAFPKDKQESHYFAARATDAAPLHCGNRARRSCCSIAAWGISHLLCGFVIRATESLGTHLQCTGKGAIPLAIAFPKINSGKIEGYRVSTRFDGRDVDQASRQSMEISRCCNRNCGAGTSGCRTLYEKEAAAMIDTWRDLPGSRKVCGVFYIMPRAEVDKELPLTITPNRASEITRVFVGRVRGYSHRGQSSKFGMRISGRISTTLKQFGRFLEPFAAQMKLNGPALEQVKRDLAAAR